MRITKAAAVAASTVALALGAVACNDDGSSNSGNPPATAAVSAAPGGAHSPSTSGGSGNGTGSGNGSGSSGGSSAGGGTAKPVPAADRCRTDELKASLQFEPPIGNMTSALLKLSNVGKRTCEVTGYPGLGGLRADNSQIDLKTTRVPFPFPPTSQYSTVLKPGANAFAGLKWSPCDKGDASCQVVTGMVVTPPDQTTQVNADISGLENKPVDQFTISPQGITVGTLQPTVGVLFQS
jgi:hypothetical protein